MQNKFSKWALIIGIVIVFNLFINYAISLVYKAPDWNSYFTQTQVVEAINTKDECLKVGGQWTENNYSDQKVKDFITTSRTNSVPDDQIYSFLQEKGAIGYCNPDFTKQQEFTDAQKIYNRNIFIALSVLGVIALIFGIFSANIILSNGFAWGGVLSLIIASARYWSDADNLVKVLILAVALGALIWLAVKKFSTDK